MKAIVWPMTDNPDNAAPWGNPDIPITDAEIDECTPMLARADA